MKKDGLSINDASDDQLRTAFDRAQIREDLEEAILAAQDALPGDASEQDRVDATAMATQAFYASQDEGCDCSTCREDEEDLFTVEELFPEIAGPDLVSYDEIIHLTEVEEEDIDDKPQDTNRARRDNREKGQGN